MPVIQLLHPSTEVLPVNFFFFNKLYGCLFYNVLEILTQVHSANKWLVNVFCCFVLQFLKRNKFCFLGFLGFFLFFFFPFLFFFFVMHLTEKERWISLYFSPPFPSLYFKDGSLCMGGKREKEPVFNFLAIHHKISNYFLQRTFFVYCTPHYIFEQVPNLYWSVDPVHFFPFLFPVPS